MIIRRTLRINRIHWTGAVLIFLLVGLAGCSSFREVRAVQADRSVQDEDMRTWQAGVQAFKKGNYQEAADYFQTLSQNAVDEDLCGKALYALACVRMIMAENQSELDKAMVLWDIWSEITSNERTEEDPRMISPFLERVVLSSQSVSDTAQAEDSESPPGGLYGRLRRKEREVQRLRTRLEIKEKENNSLKGEIRVLKGQIHKLRNQIESLETIYRSIQEKKKEVSSP